MNNNNDTLIRDYIRRTKRDTADITAERVQGSRPGYIYRHGTQYQHRKKISTFNIIILLFVFAILLVLYIGNIIAVNGLVKEIGQIEREYERVRNANEILHAELNNRTGLENIGSVATGRLGLQNPAEPPRWISVDEGEVQKLQRELDKHSP